MGSVSEDSSDHSDYESPAKKKRKSSYSEDDWYWPMGTTIAQKKLCDRNQSNESKKKKLIKKKEVVPVKYEDGKETDDEDTPTLKPQKYQKIKKEIKKKMKKIGTAAERKFLERSLEKIQQLKPGSNAFMEIFVKIEVSLFGDNNPDIIARVDKVDSNTLENLFLKEHRVIVTKNAAALGFKGPENFSFEKAKEIFRKNCKELEVIDSRTGQTVTLPIAKVLDHIDNGKRGDNDPIYNVLSLEVSNDNVLAPLIGVPTFVKEQSLVLETERILNNEINMDYGKKNKMNAEEVNERKKREQKKNKFTQYIPRYEKYIIFSQAGAYTCLHVDLAGSGVFYYVHTGQKVVYFAEPAEENLKLYRDLELRKQRIWSCDQDVLRKFQRVVVNEGEMVLIPPGFLHMVYTPVNSLVLGGNFLTETFLPLHFKMVQLEEACRKIKHLSKTQMFKNFHEFMFMHLEKCYFALMDTSDRCRSLPHLIHRGEVLLEGLEHYTKSGFIYTNQEKHELLDKLRGILGMKKGQKINAFLPTDANSIDFSVIKIKEPVMEYSYAGRRRKN